MPPAPRKPPSIPKRKITILDRSRSAASLQVDEDHPDVPFIGLEQLLDNQPFLPGEHVTLIGKTKSGKTTLAVNAILPLYRYVLALGTTPEDPALHRPLLRQRFKITSSPKLDAREHPKQLFLPKVFGLTKEIHARQAEEFRVLLSVAYAEGQKAQSGGVMREAWAIFPDELPYLTRTLGLKDQVETLFLQGSKAGTTMIVATQEPVSVPREAFGQIIHLFLWSANDQDRIDRMAEIAGQPKRFLRELLPKLASHEAVYINVATGYMARTMYHKR